MELGLDTFPWYGRIAACLLVAVSGLLVFQLYWVVPHRAVVALREQELNQKRQEISEGLRTASRLRAVEVEVEEIEAHLGSLRVALPGQRDAGELLRHLQALATQSNLSIRAFTPQAASMRALHSEWPSRLELSGTYHNFGVFFDRVSRSSQIIGISDVVIRAIDPPQFHATINAECTATTFVLNEQSIVGATGP